MAEQEERDLLSTGDPFEVGDQGVHSGQGDRDVLSDVLAVPLDEDITARPAKGPELVRVLKDREPLGRPHRSERPAQPAEPPFGLLGTPRLHFEEEERGVPWPTGRSSFGEGRGRPPVQVLHGGKPAIGDLGEPGHQGAEGGGPRDRDDRAVSHGRQGGQSDRDLGRDPEGALAPDEPLE